MNQKSKLTLQIHNSVANITQHQLPYDYMLGNGTHCKFETGLRRRNRCHSTAGSRSRPSVRRKCPLRSGRPPTGLRCPTPTSTLATSPTARTCLPPPTLATKSRENPDDVRAPRNLIASESTLSDIYACISNAKHITHRLKLNVQSLISINTARNCTTND